MQMVGHWNALIFFYIFYYILNIPLFIPKPIKTHSKFCSPYKDEFKVLLFADFHLASLQDEGYAFHQAMGMGGMGPMQRGLYACGTPYS